MINMGCDGNCPVQKNFEDFINSIEPCNGFVHKCSCNARCMHYTYKIINNTMSSKHHFCNGRRMNMHAMRWIEKVGCCTYRCDNGN